MLSTIRRELKDNLGDQLRGFRHLIQALGSDAPEISVAKQPLPPLPPELNRLVGRTFQTVSGVMATLQTIATPFRPCRTLDAGFQGFDVYFGSAKTRRADDEALTDDMYAALKVIANGVEPDALILKARVADVCRELVSASRSDLWSVEDLSDCCAALFVSLVKNRPIVKIGNSTHDDAWKTYAATSLVFGLSLSGRLPTSEFLHFAEHDAVLICGVRADIFLDATKSASKTDALVKTFASFLRHLP